VRSKVVALESCDADNLIRNEIQIFGSVNLNDEENKAEFKSVQTFIIKGKRFTP
jgi:hypothetical protein